MVGHFLVLCRLGLCVVSIVIISIFIVRVKVSLTTIINNISITIFTVIVTTDFVVFKGVYLSSKLTALCSIVARIFAVVTCRLGFSRVWFCAVLRHSVLLQLICDFQPFSSNSVSKCDLI